MYIVLHVKYPLLLSDYHETWIFSTDFVQIYLNIKFHNNSSSGSLVILGRRMDERTDRQMDKLDEGNSRFPQFRKLA